MNNYKTIFEELSKDIESIIKLIWIKNGLNPNYDVLETKKPVIKNNRLEIYSADYIKIINSGRKKFTKKVPISALILWMKQKNITPRGSLGINNLAYVIQNSIYNNGIKGKNFIEKSVDQISGAIKPILSDLILKEINKELSKIK